MLSALAGVAEQIVQGSVALPAVRIQPAGAHRCHSAAQDSAALPATRLQAAGAYAYLCKLGSGRTAGKQNRLGLGGSEGRPTPHQGYPPAAAGGPGQPDSR